MIINGRGQSADFWSSHLTFLRREVGLLVIGAGEEGGGLGQPRLDH